MQGEKHSCLSCAPLQQLPESFCEVGEFAGQSSPRGRKMGGGQVGQKLENTKDGVPRLLKKLKMVYV
jgi:hypothetical protein